MEYCQIKLLVKGMLGLMSFYFNGFDTKEFSIFHCHFQGCAKPSD